MKNNISDDAFMKCRKIQNDSCVKQIAMINNAPKVFLKLKDLGCSKRNALIFVQKPKCRTDTTKELDGPPECKILKLKVNSNFTHQGWEVTGNYEYNMDKVYQT